MPLKRCAIVAVLALCSNLASWTTSSAQDFYVSPEDTTIVYDPVTGSGSGQVSYFIVEEPLTGPARKVFGWSLSAGSDDNLLTPTAIDYGEYIATVNSGTPPGFWAPNIEPGGITVNVSYDLFGLSDCTYEVPKEVVVVTYSTVEPAFAGDTTGQDTQITPASLGNPAVATQIIVGSGFLPLNFVAGTVALMPEGLFIRGDANGDGVVEAVPDGITLLASLFGVNPTPIPCLLAGDVNGDEAVDVGDPITLLTWGFGMGTEPPHPFPNCGVVASILPCDLPACP